MAVDGSKVWVRLGVERKFRGLGSGNAQRAALVGATRRWDESATEKEMERT